MIGRSGFFRALPVAEIFQRDYSHMAGCGSQAPAGQECKGWGTGFQARTGQLD
jgi:hypothetical protein